MQADFLEVRTGVDIITAGHAYRCIFVLNKGMAIRYKVLHDGRRQVLSLILPGDFIGVPGGMFDNSLYSISGLTDAVVCAASFNTMFALFRDHPRLGAALFWVASHDAALFAEYLAGLGRQSAYERMARLVLELLIRLQIAGLADDRSFELPMTQELVADTLGLSAAHVNRTLRRRREDGLTSFEGTRLTCLDVPALSR